MSAVRQRDLHRAILTSFGLPLIHHARVLDFGCGEGEGVNAYLALGYDAWGCDIELPPDAGSRLRLIEDPYRLPFDSATFDFVFSDQVFEHVRDQHAAAREISRVLRPGAPSLHVFPGRWRPVEPHTFVPLATVLRTAPWLRLWASLGVRNGFQRGIPAAEVAVLNERYLRTQTFYRSRRKIRDAFAESFGRIEFCETTMLEHAYGRARHIAPLRHIPGFARAFSGLHMRAILAVAREDHRSSALPSRR
jgi:SAM-dependent methyltransferase